MFRKYQYQDTGIYFFINFNLFREVHNKKGYANVYSGRKEVWVGQSLRWCMGTEGNVLYGRTGNYWYQDIALIVQFLPNFYKGAWLLAYLLISRKRK